MMEDKVFEVTNEPLEVPDYRHPEAGAVVTFVGNVRNSHNGRPVARLEYEAYESMAESVGTDMVRKAIDRFGVNYAKIVHRTGTLEIGDAAVTIIVASSHRREALECCGYLIDELKAKVPIWKKEHYLEGDSGWIGQDDRPII
ncbi:MAG: molybdenum cofactor biosynthesis protein MoaE [Chthonomonadaceae bacterium]|nr:molybdenum cofactor biosynthesis protein MoaE [Chthonomonadaceae bacterium]